MLLEAERADKAKLISAFIDVTNPTPSPIISPSKEIEPVGGKIVNWSLMRQKLENDDKAKAEQMKIQAQEAVQANKLKQSKEIEDLEKELGITGHELDAG